jgi:hypothetical protein
MPCNFEVNLINRLGVIALFYYYFFNLNICLIFQKLLPYVLFLVTAAMFVGRMEPNEEIL